jgi:hypothetical protein
MVKGLIGRKGRGAALAAVASPARVPPVRAHPTEDIHALGALGAVVLVLQAGGVAPRAVHQVRHAVEGAREGEVLPPGKVFVRQQRPQYLQTRRLPLGNERWRVWGCLINIYVFICICMCACTLVCIDIGVYGCIHLPVSDCEFLRVC